MNGFNLLALVAAGNVTEDDNTLGIMQNIEREHAHTICKWLVLATGKPAHLRLIDFTGGEDIHYTPADIQAILTKQQPQPRGSK